MHMSDTLGGYDFYDENHEETLDEPRFVDQGQVTADTFGNDKAQILEINSKTGLYPLYVAYSIYRTKCRKYTEIDLTLDMQRETWNDTVQQNVFVICKTPMAKQITQRTLAGYTNTKINAHYFDDLVNAMKNKPQQFIDRVLKPSYWKKEGVKEMKFDAIVGNPPYQESTDKTSDKPVYHLFLDTAFNISDKVTFITPGRFLFNAGKTPKEWNNKVLSDGHFKVVWYKANSTDVFPNVDIKGGVAVTFRNAKEEYGAIGIYSQFQELNSIIEKVLSFNGFENIQSLIYLQNKFDLKALYVDYPLLKEKIGSKGTEKRLTTSIFGLTEIFSDSSTSGNDVKILGLINNNRVEKFVNRKYLLSNENMMKYKVIIPKSNGSGAIGEVLSTPVIGQPVIGHTQSFISIGAYDTEAEAMATLKFVKTKFARCMLGTLKVTQDNNPSTWANVPLQDFTPNSDIDWSKSIPEIDKQLYAKYGLTDDEIAFIEEKIKPME